MAQRVIVVGAGIGGLAAAIALAGRGVDVTLLEKADRAGGKARELAVAARRIDAGPTVFTMRWVFEELFDEAGLSFTEAAKLAPSTLLARHAWSATERLDLFADPERSQDAVAAFAGPVEGRAFRTWCNQAAEAYRTLEAPFLRSSRPGMLALTRRVGLGGLAGLLRLRPFSSLWSALEDTFTDPRLRQLYGRYATYCGSSPFLCPATLMLVSHVEQDGVWFVEGGMARLAEGLAHAALRLGATLRTGAPVEAVEVAAGRASGVRLVTGERIAADAVVVNADASAVGAGLLGPDIAGVVEPVPPRLRSLSAMAWAAVATARGFPLVRHGVFFGGDSREEFDAVFRRGEITDDPTVYVCAQDRGDEPLAGDADAERLLILVNAPAAGDLRTFDEDECHRCRDNMLKRLARCGLTLSLTPDATVLTTPTDFARLFPGTGGALYGRASHGWRASFLRPDASTAIPGLFLAGGSVHPGPGVPMAALSGRLAARAVLSALASTSRSRPAAMPGGMSMR